MKIAMNTLWTAGLSGKKLVTHLHSPLFLPLVKHKPICNSSYLFAFLETVPQIIL